MKAHPLVKYLSFTGRFSFAVYALLFVASYFVPDIASWLFGSGVCMAMAAVVTEGLDAGNTTAARVIPDISKKLTKIRPDFYPLDTILRNSEKGEKAINFKIQWEEEETFPRQAAVHGSEIAASSSGQPSTVTLSGNHALYFKKGDLLLVLDASGGYATGWESLRAYVSHVKFADNQIKVRAISDSFEDVVPAIPANAILIRYSDSKTEKEGVGEARMVQPVQKYNYIHTFERVLEIGRLRQNMKTYTDEDMARNLANGMRDFRENCENQIIAGLPSEDTNPDNGEKQWTMGGLEHFITSNIIELPAAGELTESQLLEWMEQVNADKESTGEKLMLVSPRLMTELAQLNLIKGQLNTSREERYLGTTVNRIVSPFGSFRLLLHKGFPILGRPRYGMILDMKYIRLREMEELYMMPLKIEESGGKRVVSKKMVETKSLEVRYEATHAILTA